MSELIVEVCKVKEVKSHEAADRLEILLIKGWEVIATKGLVNEGDLVVFIPPDSVLPETLHTTLGITKYCAELPKNADGTRPNSRRVKATRLRGLPSYGTIMGLESFTDYVADTLELSSEEVDEYCKEGVDVCDLLGIIKWEPPVKLVEADQEKEHPYFHKYTNIENWRNFPDMFEKGEEVIISEKIHGQNIRLGYGPLDDYEENPGFTLMAGSHNVRRKEGDNKYWDLFKEHPKLKILLGQLLVHVPNPQYSSAIIFGELYGIGVNDMQYDATVKPMFRAFDICIDGKYMGYEKYEFFKRYDIPHVPILYKGPYDPEIIEELTNGDTTLGSQQKFKGREGIVITAEPSSVDSIGRRRILKSVSVDYLDRKGATDSH